MSATIFWSIIAGVGFWVLIYLAALVGFALHPKRGRSVLRPPVSAAGYATAVLSFAVCNLFIGPFFVALLIGGALVVGVVVVRAAPARAGAG